MCHMIDTFIEFEHLRDTFNWMDNSLKNQLANPLSSNLQPAPNSVFNIWQWLIFRSPVFVCCFNIPSSKSVRRSSNVYPRVHLISSNLHSRINSNFLPRENLRRSRNVWQVREAFAQFLAPPKSEPLAASFPSASSSWWTCMKWKWVDAFLRHKAVGQLSTNLGIAQLSKEKGLGQTLLP